MNKPILRGKVSEDIIVQINLAGKRFKRKIVGQDFQRQRGSLFHADSRRARVALWVVRAIASHKCGRSSNSGFDVICGMSSLLVFSLALRGFSLGFLSLEKPTPPNSNLI